MRGLGFRKTSDIIATFVKKHGASSPRRAIFCTYDFDPTRFEALILPELTRYRRWFRTLVMADGAALQKTGALQQRAAASRYELAPVYLTGPGVFHPKLILLQAGNNILVGIGSANLTAGGLGGNLELMLFETSTTKDGVALAGSAVNFLHELTESNYVILPTPAKHLLHRFCASLKRVPDGPILHNLNRPLLDQMAADRLRPAHRAVVVSPWHSGTADTNGVEPQVLTALKESLGAQPVVYTQAYDGMAPMLGDNTEVHVLKANEGGVGNDDPDSTDDPSPDMFVERRHRLHAKAYISVGQKKATVWIGSANCTIPALQRSSSKGNVELLARISADKVSLSHFEADLEEYFESAKGSVATERPVWIKASSGNVICGYVSDWNDPCLTLEVTSMQKDRSVVIGFNSRAGRTREILIPKNASQCTIAPDSLRYLLSGESIKPTLWEHLSDRSVPFPVSVPCLPQNDDPEQALQEALEELGGRVPSPFRKSMPQHERNTEDEDEDEDLNVEMEALTAIAHEGKLDRIAVRVEWLRRRLAINPSPEVFNYYKKLIQSLAISNSLKTVLAEHLSLKVSRK